MSWPLWAAAVVGVILIAWRERRLYRRSQRWRKAGRW